MKIFKRDPADISLPNFTNHSQWPTTGSHLPINFPSVVLVSGCPITSNNGHPRAIYRVCARHECLQTRERSSRSNARDSGATDHVFNIDPPTLALALCATWYRRSNRLSKEEGGTRGNGVERVRVRAFLPPLWRISDVALKLKSRRVKKKKYPLEIRCTFVVYKRRRFKTSRPLQWSLPQQFRNIISTTIRGARSRSSVSKYTKYESGSDLIQCTLLISLKRLERKVEASLSFISVMYILYVQIYSESIARKCVDEFFPLRSRITRI